MNTTAKRGRPLVIAAVCCCAGVAQAQEVDLGLTIGGYHTDNIRRTSAGEESQTVGELGLRLGVARDTGRLNANIDANLAYRDYFDNAYDADLQGGFNGTVVYWFLPERLSWEFQDNYARALIDPRSVDTPGNQQNTNYFTTGPDLRLPIGDRTSVLIGGRWSDVYYEDTAAGSNRLLGTLGIERRLSERSAVSLHGTAERVEFDDRAVSSDYDRQSGYLEYAARGARTTLSVRGGVTALHDFGETTNGPLVALTLERQMSARTTLRLNVGTELTDSADAMRRDQGFGPIVVDGERPIATAGQYQSDYASLGWTLEGVRTTLDLTADLRSEDYERDDTLNRDSTGATVSLVRRLGTRLSWRLYGGWTRQDFDTSDVRFDEWNAGTGFDWLFSETVGITLTGERFEGSGDSLLGADQRDFTENRVTVRLTWTPRRR